MGRYKNRKIARKKLRKITSDPSNVFAIHYSQVQNYKDEDNNLSPLVSAIVVKSLDDSTYKHFSIHLEADRADIPKEEIENNIRELEYWTLKAFNDFVKRNNTKTWIHWDMKNIHFGFEAIKHRFLKLVEESNVRFEEIPLNKKINLNTVIEDMYGESYIEGDDKLASMLKKNNSDFLPQNYLSTENEASEFENHNYNIVLGSLDCKVDFLCKAVKNLKEKNLKVGNKDNYSIFIEFISHPIFAFLGWLLGIILAIFSMI
jgi:hypothetical protein